jgi:hypothetical protein
VLQNVVEDAVRRALRGSRRRHAALGEMMAAAVAKAVQRFVEIVEGECLQVQRTLGTRGWLTLAASLSDPGRVSQVATSHDDVP